MQTVLSNFEACFKTEWKQTTTCQAQNLKKKMCLSWSRKQNKNPRNLEHPHSGGLTVQITKHKLLTLKPSKYKLFPPRKEKWLDAKSKHPMQHFTSQERKLTKKGFHAKRKKKSLAKSKVCLRQEKKIQKPECFPAGAGHLSCLQVFLWYLMPISH